MALGLPDSALMAWLTLLDVRFGSEADIAHVATHVSFGPEADIGTCNGTAPEIGLLGAKLELGVCLCRQTVVVRV